MGCISTIPEIIIPGCGLMTALKIKTSKSNGKLLSDKVYQREAQKFFNFLLNKIPSGLFNQLADLFINYRASK